MQTIFIESSAFFLLFLHRLVPKRKDGENMQKFRAAVIAATLAIMFFIPMSVMGEYEYL